MVNCPICNNFLNYDDFYKEFTCSTKSQFRIADYMNHFRCRNNTSIMIIGSFILYHKIIQNTTGIYTHMFPYTYSSSSSINYDDFFHKTDSIFKTELLDWDYSKPYDVIKRIETLILFS